MGEYKSMYEKYYNGLQNKVPGKVRKPTSPYDNNYRGKKPSGSFGEKLGKQIIFQLIGAFVLLLIFMGLKLIPLESTKEAYTVTKEALNENFDLEEAVMTMNIPGIEGFKEDFLDGIDEMKSFFTGEQTLKEEIKEKYMVPVLGNVTKLTGEDVGVVIQTDNEINVVASFDGKVREIKDDGEEKHIIIDHGNGVETYYGLLSTIEVSVNDEIEKGQVLGKSGALDSEETNGIVYKISYMGIEKDPFEMMNFSSVNNV